MYSDGTWTSNEFQHLVNGKYHLVLSLFFTRKLRNDNVVHTWETKIKNFTDGQTAESQEEQLLCVGSAALMLFVQNEWTGPSFDEETQKQVELLGAGSARDVIIAELIGDGEDIHPVEYPHLLHFAITTFQYSALHFPTSFLSQLYLLRGLFVQQLVLDERSPKLHKQLDDLVTKLQGFKLEHGFEVSFPLEAARIWLYYGYVEKASQNIDQAAAAAGLRHKFTGALGRRTHYQDFDLAQLVVEIDVIGKDENEKADTVTSEIPLILNDLPSNVAPKNVSLEDDVRLEEIKLADPDQVKDVELSYEHVAILLATLMLRKKSMADDELSLEESRTLVQRLLRSQGRWSVQLSALLARSHLERTSRRTVERAMLQVQAVVDEINTSQTPVQDRVNSFFLSYLPTKREVELTLADFLLSLGAVKSALDICLRLQQWETAIACYNVLQLRHKAKELIEQELVKGETPKLWCLLGDATDDVECYSKAWALSGRKSARAQRHWANFLYTRKKYGESIEHFEKSLEMNSLQSDLWFRLGFAALHEEQWELGAKAYRRYCTLEHDSFESWNNLARCYCETKQMPRAWRALKEALKVDTSNWRVWDNYMRVSADVKEYSELVRGYNQVLELKKASHVDMPVVVALVHGVFNVMTDQQRTSMQPQVVQLISRIASQPSPHAAELWMLAADVASVDESATGQEKQRECLFKAHGSAVSASGWEMDLENCRRVVAVLERLLAYAEADPSFKKFFLLIAKPSISTINRCHPDLTLCSALNEAIAQLQHTPAEC